jgi:hypothetical protein
MRGRDDNGGGGGGTTLTDPPPPPKKNQQTPNHCRQTTKNSYVASTLRAGMPDSAADAQSVIAVSAMEAIGLSQALARYHDKRPARRPVPFTVVRGMSNHVMQPVARQAPQSSVWVNGPEIPEDFVNGYAYAIQSSASVVLSLLQARCRAAGGSAGRCSYNVGAEGR